MIFDEIFNFIVWTCWNSKFWWFSN